MATDVLTSASGFIALLDEREDDRLKEYALEQLNGVVDQFWPEMAASVSELYGGDAFLAGCRFLAPLRTFSAPNKHILTRINFFHLVRNSMNAKTSRDARERHLLLARFVPTDLFVRLRGVERMIALLLLPPAHYIASTCH